MSAIRNSQYAMAGVTLLLSLLAAGMLCGCETVSAVGTGVAQATGVISSDEAESITRSVLAVEKTWQDLTPEQEYYIGRAVVAQVLQSYQPLDEPQVNEYLNLLGQSLAIFSERPETFGGYHFLLLDSDEINAFAAPGGLILVTRGMVRCCQDEDELAAVLAHEICHVEQKHGLSAIKQSRLTEAFTIVALESAKQMGGEELAALADEFEGSVSDVVKTLTTSGYSRKQERSADAAAVGLLQRAGYPPVAMITMLEHMEARLTSSGGLGFAKTHPSAKSRREALQTRVAADSVASDPVRQQRFCAAMQPIVAGK
ncbi:MAG: M48 family metalloprotease [Sedimentisphaerales bacterium]|nr:M48 family metalloprotease [Sedimentisphaerales bacterium]